MAGPPATAEYDHEYVFVGQDGRLGENGLHSLLQNAQALAGLAGDPPIKPHSIRHAAATRLLRNGADLRSIQAWLGDSSLAVTSIYLHTDEQQVRKIAPLVFLPRPDALATPAPQQPAQPNESARRWQPVSVQDGRQ